MFRIECFCDDGKLAKVLWLLQGHVYNLTNSPVINAKKTANGAVKARIPNGEIAELFGDYVRKRKLQEVRAGDVRSFVTEIGYADTSYSHILTKLQAAGALKRVAGAGSSQASYRVMAKATKAKAPKAESEAAS
jgi:hypothetical protein